MDIAREDAGLEEEEIIRARVKLDYDDRAVKYDVEFYSEDTEYDYEIDANTGEILEMDAEIEDDFWKFSKEERDKDLSIISMDEAVQIILDKVPGAEETNLRVEMERDDGKIIYEGKLFHDSNEYEFEINAETGTIISWEKESVWN